MPSFTVTKELTTVVLDALFPPTCLGCSLKGEWLCERCLEGIPFVGCVPLKEGAKLERVLAISSYHDPLMGALLRAFKYQRALCLEEDALRRVVRRFAYAYDFSSQLVSVPTMIVPLAMDPDRARTRGVDHAFRLARLLQSELFPEIPVVQALMRTRHTRTNASLSEGEAREQNVRDVFACRAPIEGERVLLVDDVYTTGATLHEAADVLRRSGALDVQGFVFAQS